MTSLAIASFSLIAGQGKAIFFFQVTRLVNVMFGEKHMQVCS